jgi:hypothetical protein
MKKTLYVVLFCAISMHLSSNGISSQPTVQAPATPSFVLTYNWYLDPDLISFTGSSLSIAQEIDRLRRMWPAYTFSSEGDAGLVEFEFGYFPNQPVRPIYSNLWFY